MKFYKYSMDDDNDFKQFFNKYATGANYNRIQKHLNEDCICFITAYLPYYDTEDRQRNISICNQENNRLETAIRNRLKYSYIKVKGHYTYTVHNEKTNTDESLPFDEVSFMVTSNTFREARRKKDEKTMLEESNKFKEKMIELRDMFNQDSILIRYYAGNGRFITEMRYSEEAKKSGRQDYTLNNQMTEEGIKDFWTTHTHTRFVLKDGEDNSQIKLASLEFDFTYEQWHPIASWERGYNWERYLFNRKK